MKVSRFLSICMFITVFSLLYVYQQTEIFRLGYVGQKSLNAYQELLDKNNLLRYNIQKNASLVNIGGKISGSTDFQMPDSYRLVRVSASEGAILAGRLVKEESLLARIFGVRKQAEAETINP